MMLGEPKVYFLCRVATGHWGLEDYQLQLFYTILSTNYRLFDTLSTTFIELSKVAKSCKRVPNVAKKLPKAAQSCQKWSKAVKSCKKVPDVAKKVPKVAKVAKLSTKLSTI